MTLPINAGAAESLATVHEAVARAFSSHNFRDAYAYFSAKTVWTMVGGAQYDGREQIAKQCDATVAYLRTVTTSFLRFDVFAGTDFVVVDSLATYTNADQQRSVVASCDIYKFDGALVQTITSYAVELPS